VNELEGPEATLRAPTGAAGGREPEANTRGPGESLLLPCSGRAPGPTQGAGARTAPDRWSFRLGMVVLFLLLLASLPLFLRMPVYDDVTFFDLGARNVLRGGVHYRDVVDPNLPGMLWLHLGIRSLLGWGSEAIRLVDFLVVALTVGLLMRWLRPLGLTRAARAWTAVVLFGFYFATSEVCHCQRDVWMLPPALGALLLRRRRMAELFGAQGGGLGGAARSVAEGACWGMAFWVKPFVAIPALACWLVAAAEARGAPGRAVRTLVADAACVLVGGLLAAAPGVAWLVWSGSWSPFWDVVLGWNPEHYSANVHGPLRRTWFLLQQFLPWGCVHLVAVPLALSALWRVVRDPAALRRGAPLSGASPEALLAGFYLGWLLQANYLQSGFLYHLVPPVLLAMTVIADRRWLPGDSRLGWVILTGFLGLAAVRHPLGDFGRTGLWGRCWRGGSAELQNRLALTTEPRRPDWVALEQVADFLREQGVRDGELTCYSFGTLPLYLKLDVAPSTRHLSLEELIALHPSQRSAIRAELAASPQRYVVTDLQFLAADLQAAGVIQEQAVERSGNRWVLSPDFAELVRRRYPWSEPVVFRAGPYLVHQDTGSLRRHPEVNLSRPDEFQKVGPVPASQ
jgi:hypothetical protein